MIDPRKCALFIPPELKKFKLNLFERIGGRVGKVIRGDFAALDKLPDEIIPVVGCTPQLRPIIDRWITRKRTWIYWDRGYYFRVFATWLPRGENGGMYRWHLNSFQMQYVRPVPCDRYERRKPPVLPWRKGGQHIVIAIPTPTYARFHRIENWTDETLRKLATVTDRRVVTRDKESSRSLQVDLDGAHALIAHGSNAAVEAVIMGCPVFVDQSSAAALVGLTELTKIEAPIYPERQPWLNSLAYCQFNEQELVDGTLWRLID